MKFATCLIALCLILGASILVEANNNQYGTTKAATTRTRRAPSQRRTTTQAYTTRATTKAPATYTTRRQTTQAYTTRRQTTQAYTTRATTKAPATYTTRRQTTQAYTTRATTKAPATYTTRRQTTQAYTTRRQTTQAYTTRATTKAPATYTTRRQTTQAYTTRATTKAPATYTTRRQTTQAYTTRRQTTHATYPTPYSTETTTTATTTTTEDNSMSERDIAILNFALNLEYLEAEFYCAAIGRTPSYEGQVGGTVTGGETVNFTTPEFRQYAQEIATDEENHVVFLRRVLGDRAVDRPDINIAGGVNGSFGQAAKAAGGNAGLNGATQDALATFSPYTNELYFLHGAFIFEDVGVTAYKGALPLLRNNDYVSAAAGILAVEAYHAGNVRTLLYGVRRTVAIAANAVNGSTALRVQDIVNAISGLRGALDGSANGGNDQGIVVDDGNNNGSGSGSGSGDDDGAANIVPADDDSLAYGRTVQQVLNIVYGAQGSTMGLFFPNGLNGDFSALL